jgi:hypothetical protein
MDEQTKPSHKDALKGSLAAVIECRKLILQGHYVGNKAGRVVNCVRYLEALEGSIREQLKAEPKAE